MRVLSWLFYLPTAFFLFHTFSFLPFQYRCLCSVAFGAWFEWNPFYFDGELVSRDGGHSINGIESQNKFEHSSAKWNGRYNPLNERYFFILNIFIILLFILVFFLSLWLNSEINCIIFIFVFPTWFNWFDYLPYMQTYLNYKSYWTEIRVFFLPFFKLIKITNYVLKFLKRFVCF